MKINKFVSNEIKYCLPIIKSKTDQVLKIILKNQDYDFFEIWLDYIQDLNFNFVLDLKNKYGKKLIFLFRRQNLEKPKLNFEKRKKIIDIVSKSCFLDLDISQRKDLQYLKANSKKVNLILSYHNYSETPNDEKLKDIVETMNQFRPAIYKVATFCKSDEEVLRLIDLLIELKDKGLRCIVLGMGKKGIITRIAGAILGNEITFAPISGGGSSASGQLTKKELGKILKKIKVCYFVADPVKHSLSPQMHEAGYRALGIENDFLFLRHCVKPKDLKKFVQDIKKDPHFRGASISIPHKIEIMKYLDEIDAVAEKIGAVNTIIKNGRRLKGYNTDWLGILNPLKQNLPNLKGKTAAIIGAGGAARAAVYALKTLGSKVTIFNRNQKRGKELAKDFGAKFEPLDNINKISDFDIVIHATKVGLKPKNSPIIKKRLIKPNQVIFDVVYSKDQPKTKLIKQARLQKAKTISGIEMLLHQGFTQFELFTGRAAPRKAMRETLR